MNLKMQERITWSHPGNYCEIIISHILGILLMNSYNTDIFFSN